MTSSCKCDLCAWFSVSIRLLLQNNFFIRHFIVLYFQLKCFIFNDEKTRKKTFRNKFIFSTNLRCNIYGCKVRFPFQTFTCCIEVKKIWLLTYCIDSHDLIIFSNHSLTHWGRDNMADFSQTTLSNEFSWIEIIEFRLKFHWSLFRWVLLIIFQHWFW